MPAPLLSWKEMAFVRSWYMQGAKTNTCGFRCRPQLPQSSGLSHCSTWIVSSHWFRWPHWTLISPLGRGLVSGQSAGGLAPLNHGKRVSYTSQSRLDCRTGSPVLCLLRWFCYVLLQHRPTPDPGGGMSCFFFPSHPGPGMQYW